jgi:hypothetical protein
VVLRCGYLCRPASKTQPLQTQTAQ